MIDRHGPLAARHLVCSALLVCTLGGCAGAIQTRPEDIPRLEAAVQTSASASDLTQLGIAYYQAKRYGEAKTTLERARQAGSKDGTTSLYLGLTNEELGDFTAAHAAYDQYIATNGRGGSLGKEIEARIALVSRQELRQQAKVALEREQQIAQEPPTPSSIAVLPFKMIGMSADMAPLQTALAEMIVTDIGFTTLKSIERVRVKSMLDEMSLAVGGVTTEETGARMGHLLRAEKIVQGQMTGNGDNVSVDAVVLNVAQRTPGDPVTTQGQIASIFNLEKQIVFGILDAAKYPLTAAEREKINENKTANLLAFMAFGRGLEAMDRGDYDQASSQFRQATQIDPSFGAARVQATQTTQLSDAAQTTTSEVAIQAVPPVGGTTLAQSIAADVNPSPAQVLVTPATENNGQTQVTTAASERNINDRDPTPPIGQAQKATVIITVKNPTVGQLRIPLIIISKGGR
jgi:tetratricopeptide (TPR) repeat protein